MPTTSADRIAHRTDALNWLRGQLRWERTLAELRGGAPVPVLATVPVRNNRPPMAA